jgi:hypothetical protein
MRYEFIRGGFNGFHQQKVFLLPAHFNRFNYKMGAKGLREQIFLIGIFLLWASTAYGAAGEEGADIDVLGSLTNNTTIAVPEGTSIGVDILGSTAENIQIGYPQEACCPRAIKECAPCGEEKVYKTPWDDFKRPLCYPWSSYIPTRYNRNFIREDSGYLDIVPGTATLGRGKRHA